MYSYFHLKLQPVENSDIIPAIYLCHENAVNTLPVVLEIFRLIIIKTLSMVYRGYNDYNSVLKTIINISFEYNHSFCHL